VAVPQYYLQIIAELRCKDTQKNHTMKKTAIKNTANTTEHIVDVNEMINAILLTTKR
jgi:hypothetical protein